MIIAVDFAHHPGVEVAPEVIKGHFLSGPLLLGKYPRFIGVTYGRVLSTAYLEVQGMATPGEVLRWVHKAGTGGPWLKCWAATTQGEGR